MISHLHIENIAVIERMDVVFGAGLNLLTGETGAGKSVVIDALGAVLGARTSRDLVRLGASSAQVSAIFWNAETDEETSVSRDIMPDGRSVCKINGRPVTVAQLKEFGGSLVRVHGQHDSRLLLDENAHLDFVDRFGGCSELLEGYQFRYREWKALCKERDALLSDMGDKERRLETLRYQLDEIDGAELQSGEDEILAERRALLKNARKITAAVTEAYIALYGDDESEGAYDLLSQAAASLSSVADASEDLSKLYARAEELKYAVGDAAEDARSFSDDMEPEELERIEGRLDIIYRLKKYGANAAEILEYGERVRAELDGIEHADERLEKLEHACKAKLVDTQKAASKLSDSRKSAAEALQKRLHDELTALDMEKTAIIAEIMPCELCGRGAETLRFLISANVGEPPKPLGKVASGGELARVMLAMMNVLAEDVPTMVFDEVDTGISGRAATRVAEKLKNVSRGQQVLCVTHLPQIAAAADTHFHIEKGVENGRTFTKIQTLDRNQRIEEIAKIMGNLSESARKSANELIERYEK
ncbi:DNA repair protein RecN [Clostridia bacterium]|nr:DNA repair protein RecN [Clostridia bacterium]GHV32794.1 DNA repair protein RecN [Clostridia bacterium]